MFYCSCMILVLAYAWAAGGSEERFGASLNVVASILSYALTPAMTIAFRNPEVAIWMTDIAAAVAYCLLMCRSRSFWPVWAFGFAAAAVMATAARLLVPNAPVLAYFATESVWPYGTMTAIVVGTAARTRPRMALQI